MPESTALCVVVGGKTYVNYAKALFASAHEFFHPTERVSFHMIPGDEGWPNGTMRRYRHLVDHPLPRANYIFHCDADMLFEAECGPEILPPNGKGIVATQHPGYVGKQRAELPYETRPQSGAYLAPEHGSVYYCGGFVGGERAAFETLAMEIVEMVDDDATRGLVPIWHDESCLNEILAFQQPTLTLSPAYCHPDRDDYYRQHVWKEDYPRIVVALDKRAEERGDR